MKKILTSFAMIAVTPLLFISCGQNPKEQAQEVVAYVNNEPIFASELNNTMARMARQDPSYKATPQDRQEQLDFIIDKKLIIQEAVNSGLAQEEKFVDAIKSYWEQTLIRDFIDRKSKEYNNTIAVSDKEIQDYYGNMDKVVSFIVLKSEDRAFIEEAHQKVLAKDDAKLPWERIGPVRYAQIASKGLREAFALDVGSVRTYEENGEYYLLAVVQKELVPVQPLETLKPEIKKEIIAAKEKILFDDWLASRRKNARIKMLAR